MAAKDWAHKILDEIPTGFFGEIVFTVRAGEIRQVTRTETFVSPELTKQTRASAGRSVTMIAGVPASLKAPEG